MKIEQYVMAYGVEQDRLRAILPEGYESLRPVLRINTEVRNAATGYVEFNTAVEKDGNKGWLNIGYWDQVSFECQGKKLCSENQRSSKVTKNFVIVSLSGNSQIVMLMAAVLEKHFRRILRKSKKYILNRILR